MSSLTDVDDNLLAASPALAAALANAYLMGNSESRPAESPASREAVGNMYNAAQEVSERPIDINFHEKKDPSFVDALQTQSKDYGRYARVENFDPNNPKYNVYYNPNADAAYVAHELGHGVSQQTKLGAAVDDLRYRGNLRTISGAAGGTVASLLPGDDDLTASIAAAYLTQSPAIADEIMASLKAEDIIRATGDGKVPLKSRARLAGALISYLTTPLVTGSIGNYAGNLVDDEIVGPPRNAANVA